MSAAEAEVALAELERRIGHAFADRALLREALTHASVFDARQDTQRNYERLEFLGDRVLGLVVAEKMYAAFPDAGESGLAPRLNALVNRSACARAARRADLGAALVLSRSEEDQGGREKEAILADVCESVIAALFLDGGYGAARQFIERFWGDEFDDVSDLPRDAKTALQEWAAAHKLALNYKVVSRSGPEHAPRFVVEASIEGMAPARGEGGSKREAERAAAAALLAMAGVNV